MLGVGMEILQFLLSLFKDNALIKNLMPIFELLKANNFDLKSTLSQIDIEKLQPLIQELSTFFQSKSPASSTGLDNALSPILELADKDIIFALNKAL